MKKTNWVIGGVLLVAGVILTAAPVFVVKALVVLLGLGAVADGVYSLMYEKSISTNPSYQKTILYKSVANIVMGLVAVIVPLFIAKTAWFAITYILGIYLVISAFGGLFASSQLKDSEVDRKALTVDHSLPWKDQIDFFYSAYEEAFAAAQGTGIDVFFGIEYNFEGDEYLLYGISKQWLYDHPQMMRWSHQELFDEINRIGGLMLQAHPFRKREYMRVFAQHPECVHGFEVYNSCNRDDENPKALALAKEHKLLMTGGSDIHNAADCERFIVDGSFPLSGVELEHQVHTVEEFISEIKSGTAKVINRN